MKNTKKLLGLMLALILMVSLCVPALAADEPAYTINVTDSNTAVVIAGTTFTAYKIFDATYDAATDAISYSYDESTCLPVTYEGKSGAALLAWLGEVNGEGKLVRNDEEVRNFADYVYENYIKDQNVTSYKSAATAVGESATIGLESAGYYLVFGSGKAVDGNSVVTAAVSLTSAGPNQTVEPKFDAPTLRKEIYHDDLHVWDVVSDYQIGDRVEFRVITSVPDTYGYETYTYVIHDTMESTLEHTIDNVNDFRVTVGDQGPQLDANYLSLETSDDGCTFELQIDILKAVKDGLLKDGDNLYTYYEAVLGENAILYTTGPQANEAYLEFSNNPYGDGTGKTTEDKVYAWTYSMGVEKVDSTGNALSGAKFVLSTNGNLSQADMVIVDGAPTVTDNLIKLVRNGSTYRIAKADEASTVYVMEAGTVTITGLNDAVDYFLYEIEAPAGYNLATAPVQFKITAQYSADGSERLSYEATTDNTTDKYPIVVVDGKTDAPSTELSTDVINQSGTVLPTTGGMGTTIFYILGGLLVAAAVVLLITRKRMSSES